MPTDFIQGQVKLNGKPYRINLASYRVKDITDFAPRAATPGGSIIHSELGLYQPYMKTDWRHGLGFIWETDPMGYLTTDGNIDTRHPGIVMMFTQAVESDTADQKKEGFTVFNSKVYTWGSGGGGVSGVREFASSTWSDIQDDGPADYGNVNCLLATKTYLFICPDGARIQKMTTGNVVTDAGDGANATDYRWMVIHGGYIYAGKDDSAVVYRDNNEDLSGLSGDTGDDPNYILVGGGRYATIRAISFMGRLLVATADGLWEILDDLTVRKVLDYTDQVSTDNFRAMAIHNNRLVFTIRDGVYMWNGTTIVPITPRPTTDTFPYTTYGRFDNFVPVDDFMFCTARTNETTYEEHLLCWDGVGWHKMLEIVTNGTDTVTAMGYDSVNNYLWYHLDATADKTYYVQFQNQSAFPHANFPTTGTHSLKTSRMEMGFPWVDKSSPSITIEADNCTSARYLTIYYRIDDETTWHEWGGTGNGRITSNGATTLWNPAGSQNTTVEYEYLSLRIDFTTDATAQSPILESMTLRFIMRPDVLFGHFMQIPVATRMRTGAAAMTLDRAKDIITEVKKARASKSPVPLVDPYGAEVYGYISSYQQRALEQHGSGVREGNPDIESVIEINYVELMPRDEDTDE
jgi:hypothetical protein